MERRKQYLGRKGQSPQTEDTWGEDRARNLALNLSSVGCFKCSAKRTDRHTFLFREKLRYILEALCSAWCAQPQVPRDEQMMCCSRQVNSSWWITANFGILGFVPLFDVYTACHLWGLQIENIYAVSAKCLSTQHPMHPNLHLWRFWICAQNSETLSDWQNLSTPWMCIGGCSCLNVLTCRVILVAQGSRCSSSVIDEARLHWFTPLQSFSNLDSCLSG
jgi:hypothetical protein